MLRCREEIVSIVALLSADSIMINTTAQREQANNVRAKFASSEGDHITLLNIFRAFRTAKQNRVGVASLIFMAASHAHLSYLELVL